MQERLTIENQSPLGLTVKKEKEAPLTCLGLIFNTEEERRAYFTEQLQEKLKDPEFRKIEGFPLGSDEDILALSDPPYYTACPNPWLAEFIQEWESQKPAKPEDYAYQREPYAADVSEGKNDPIYNAHSYHTKVPHKAIMRYILHYTEPGDIVFDGFCGTGMTGVAAQMCGDREAVESLGYQVQEDGVILRKETDENDKTAWVPFSKLGPRRAALNDLSPAATFIAYNYNTPVDVEAFEREARRILKEVEDEYGWMYQTIHTDGKTKGRINYTVWSDVFVCPECAGEMVFWEVAVDKEEGKVRSEFPCPHCQVILTKRQLERAWSVRFDSAIEQTIRQAKQVPVLINYSVGRKRYEKTPDQFDWDLIEEIEDSEAPYWFPTTKIPKGDKTGEPLRIGITHTHHFYTKRNLRVFSSFNARCQSWLKWVITGTIQRGSKQHQIAITRIGGSKAKEGGATAGHRRGTLYLPSNQIEANAISLVQDRANSIKKALSRGNKDNILSTCSLTHNNVQLRSCFDYLFFDPPFGSNINYSELNSIWESWLKVWTNTKPEAIESRTQGKGLAEYRKLMIACFQEAYRLLKPGRWMTVEFSNTKAAVWNNIQSALLEAGFIVANVSIIDKKRGGLNAITGVTAVKQDLAISAYKPNDGFEERFLREVESEEGVWSFIRSHMKYLPVVKRQGRELVAIPERDPRLLYDQVIAYYVRKNYTLPLSSQEFQAGLKQRFEEKDGMYFLPEQVVEYERKRMTTERLVQVSIFVTDEASAIQWLRQILKEKPQSTQDIHPQFIQETQRAWSKNETPLELKVLLEQNFLCYDGQGEVPSQIHGYLSSNYKELRNLEKEDPALRAKAKDRWYAPDPHKAGDLEKLREKALLREFELYRQAERKRLKVFRMEAVRVGFREAWRKKDYQTIVEVGRKIPEQVLQEDQKLLMYFDNAQIRLE